MLDLHNLQGGILHGYSREHWRIDLARWDSADHCREWLRAQLDDAAITTAHAKPHGATTNIAFTADGLKLLGITSQTLAAMSPALNDTMAQRAHQLGDHGPSAPAHWSFAPPGDVVHGIVLRSAGRMVDGVAATVDDLLPAIDPRWPFVRGQRRAGQREPFGFRDGSSTPILVGSGQPMSPGAGVPTSTGWRPLAAGEVFLGHADESGATAGLRAVAHMEHDGTYVAIRQLQQHVHQFATFVDALAARTERSPAEVRAMLVGRWPDEKGTPYEVTCGADANDFVYSTKNNMPVSAHIRRANPRDGIEFADKVVPRHLMIRRGVPYGAPGSDDEGLMFIAYCADLARQFEFVQGQWLNDGNRFLLGRESDALTGNRRALSDTPATVSTVADTPAIVSTVAETPATMSTVADEQRASIRFPDNDGQMACHHVASFVTTRGGLYGFVPSMSVLDQLARGTIA
jgi:Dyp-type peroxidase family